MKTTGFACAAIAVAISIGSSSALAPRSTTSSTPGNAATSTMTRRSATLAVIGSAFSVAAPAFALPFGKDDRSPEEIAAIEAQKEKMRKKIEASKKNYRTTNDLVKERKQTTNYTCLLDPSKCDGKEDKK